MSAPQLRSLPPLLGHTRRVSSVAFGADGSQLLSGSLDRTPRLWNVSAGACGRTLVGETSDVNSVALSPDGRVAVTGSGEMTLVSGLARVWDVPAGTPLRELAGHEGDALLRAQQDSFLEAPCRLDRLHIEKPRGELRRGGLLGGAGEMSGEAGPRPAFAIGGIVVETAALPPARPPQLDHSVHDLVVHRPLVGVDEGVRVETMEEGT